MFNMTYASIQEIHKAYKEKQIGVRELVMQSLSAIAKTDQCSGGLHSVLEINPDALFIADMLDKKLQNGDIMLPLFGIPILLKDNINTVDRLHTSAGSVALSDNFAPYDAHIVNLLKKAGAIILGKANMTEFANFMTDGEMPDGYSSRGGQVLNPYNNLKTPSGSSSGSAVSVAAGLCTVSVGTETCGSLISPASQNGIVGIKPTLGLVGRSGITPISNTLDTAGPMTRNVQDAAILLSVMTGKDPDDFATHALGDSAPLDYVKYLNTDSLIGVRIGINRLKEHESSVLKQEEKSTFDNLCAVLLRAGAELIDDVEINTDYNKNKAIWRITSNEFKSSINYYLSTLGTQTQMRSLKDIIEYNEAHADIALRYGQSTLIDVENNTSGTMCEQIYIDALIEREKTIIELDRLFTYNNFDILLCENFTDIAPFTGFPSMTIPIGQRQDKMPIGSYWIARRFDEATLLKVTHAAEQILALSLKPDLLMKVNKV